MCIVVRYDSCCSRDVLFIEVQLRVMRCPLVIAETAVPQVNQYAAMQGEVGLMAAVTDNATNLPIAEKPVAAASDSVKPTGWHQMLVVLVYLEGGKVAGDAGAGLGY